MDKLKVGIIGCGQICSEHIKNVKKSAKMHLVGVADINEAAAQNMKQAGGAEYATTDIDGLIQDKRIDALLIFSSHHTHADLIKKACAVKKAFFVEKPVALSSAECAQIQRLVKEAGVKNQVGYWMRYSPLMAKVAEAIPAPYLVVARCLKGGGDKFSPSEMIAKADVKAKGGYFDQAGYLYDIILRLVPSTPVSIQSVSVSERISNTICSNVRFANGAIATVINGNIGSGGFLGKWFVEIIGGAINATIVDFRKLVFSPDTVKGVAENNYHNGFNEQMDMFAGYVLEGDKSPMDVWDASLPTMLMEKAVQSIINNRIEPITLEKIS